jgi:hypothetical protein
MTETLIPDARRNLLWTEEEDARLLALRASRTPAPRIAAALGRPVGAVYVRARKLDSRVMARAVWTPEEDVRLEAMVREGRLFDAAIAEIMNRSYCSVRWRIDALGLKGARPKIEKPAVAAAPETPRKVRRSPAAGKPAWRPDEVARLAGIAARGDVPIAAAAAEIGRPLAGVRAKARELGLAFPDPQKSRISEEDARIAEAWKASPDVERVAEATSLSVRSVRKRAVALGLRTPRRRVRPEDQAGVEDIRRFALTMTITEAARAAGRDVRTLKKIAEAEGISFRQERTRPKASSAPKRVASQKPARRPAGKIPRAVEPASAPRVPVFRVDRERPAPEATIVVAAKPAPKVQGAADRLALIRQVAARMREQGRMPA